MLHLTSSVDGDLHWCRRYSILQGKNSTLAFAFIFFNVAQEEKRSVLDEINCALPTPRHDSRQVLEDREESNLPSHDPYPTPDEGDEEPSTRSVHLELDTEDQEDGNTIDTSTMPSSQDPLTSVKETVAMLSNFICYDVKPMRHSLNSDVSPDKNPMWRAPHSSASRGNYIPSRCAYDHHQPAYSQSAAQLSSHASRNPLLH